MSTVMRVQQRGVTFGGMLFGAFLLVFLGIFALKIIPAYMQDAQIKSMLNAIAHDQNVQQVSPDEIRQSFDRRADIDGIKSIRGSDIEIVSKDGKLFLSTSYSVKIPVGGNVSLVMEFNPTSAD